MLGETKNPFSLTRVALSKGRRAKSKFLSVRWMNPSKIMNGLSVSLVVLFLAPIAEGDQLTFLRNNPALHEKLTRWEREAGESVNRQVEILRTGESVAKGHAAVELGKMGLGAKGAILALVETLTNRSSLEWRVFLKQPGTGKGTSPAEEAGKAIITIGEPAVEPLIEALHDDNPDLREMSVWVLGEIRDPRALEPLIYARKDGNPSVRLKAKGALKQIDANWVKSQAASNALPSLTDAMQDKNRDVSDAATEVLGEIADPRAVKPLLSRLGDYRSANVNWALRSIGEPSVEPLLAALKDTNPLVRERAARILGAIGDKRAVDPLRQAQADEIASVRQAVKQALQRFEIGAAAKD